LFLFCKYQIDGQFHSLCIQITTVFYYLQFLPNLENAVPELLDEVRSVAKKYERKCLGVEVKAMNYAFENNAVPNRTKWVTATFTAQTQLDKIPLEGKHYSSVFGLTATLSEAFLLRRHISGPCWIRVTGAKSTAQVSSIPMFKIPDINAVSVLQPAPGYLPRSIYA
jgi:hypothetical protein